MGTQKKHCFIEVVYVISPITNLDELLCLVTLLTSETFFKFNLNNLITHQKQIRANYRKFAQSSRIVIKPWKAGIVELMSEKIWCHWHGCLCDQGDWKRSDWNHEIEADFCLDCMALHHTLSFHQNFDKKLHLENMKCFMLYPKIYFPLLDEDWQPAFVTSGQFRRFGW